MPVRKRFFLLAAAFLLLACSLPSLVTPAPPGGSSPGPAIILDPGAATPTPFLPIPPTPTYLPTDLPTPTTIPSPTPGGTGGNTGPVAKSWEDYPGPTVWPDIDIPPPTGLLAQPEGQVNILLLGSDQRPNDDGFRTDTILLLTLKPSLGTANVTVFPRDLYVYIPGYTVQRINTAFGWGDFEALALTFEYNLGVRPDHYALINLWAFRDAIDSLGGIDVEVAFSLTDQRDGYGYYTVPAGLVHMDGATALWYARSRYATGDFDRGRRQQEVLLAIFKKVLSLDGIQRAPQLYDIYRQNVATDMTYDEMAPLLPLAAQLSDTTRIHNYAIGPAQVVDWVNTSGAQVLLPIREAVLEVMRQALNSP